MSIDIVKTELLIHEKREHIVLMDDYGSEHHVYVPVSGNRALILADHTAMMQKNQDAMEAYALTHGHDLSTNKTAGVAKKAGLLAKKKPATPAPAIPAAPAQPTTAQATPAPVQAGK